MRRFGFPIKTVTTLEWFVMSDANQKPSATSTALNSAHAKTIAAAEDPDAPPWMKRVALLTGVLAAFAGFLTVRSTSLTNDAIYMSNQAVLKQTKASDAWAEYQADSIKSHILDTQLLVLPADSPLRADLTAKQKEYADTKDVRLAKATKEQQDRDAQLTGSRANLDQRNLLGYAGMGVQLAIALASVAALTKRRVAFDIAIIIGLAGTCLTAYAILAPHFRS